MSPRAFKRGFARSSSLVCLVSFLLLSTNIAEAKHKKSSNNSLSARSAVIVDARTGRILFGKNPNLKLPPASTTKLMTVLIALEKLPLKKKILISRNATNVATSKAGLTAGVSYTTRALVIASLVSSSNDAAVALAEAVDGSEKLFVERMNKKALELGMKNTRFINATGLPGKSKQYTTASDLAILMRRALKDKRIDEMMGFTSATIGGNDGRHIQLKSHNKMLWRAPGLVKGKTGWTASAKHTFVGTNYARQKSIAFAMLSSSKPWTDIKHLASLGLLLKNRAL